MKKRILTVFGTRPEAIKMVPLVQELKRRTDEFESAVCVTAQHREMLDQVLRIFCVAPDYDLDLMKNRQTLNELTGNVINGITDVIERFRPDVVLVHGDTTTTFSAAVAAFYAKIPVGHVEAGLRTGDIYAPWPEEFNRKVAGVIARYHFAPTDVAADNLLAEGVSPENVFITGNTVIDALLLVSKRLDEDKLLSSEVNRTLPKTDPSKRQILVTCHRRENWGEPMRQVFSALRTIADRDDVEIVYPVHLNPAVREPAYELLGGHRNIHLIEPQEYLPFVALMKRAHIILTDSGGIQEEAPSLGKPVLVVRDVTERPEAVSAGTVKLVGTQKEIVYEAMLKLLDSEDEYARMTAASNPYGDGYSSKKIADILAE